MAQIQIITTLETKRDAIERTIAAYEARIEAAKRDLSHVNATLAMFAGPEGRKQFPAYMDTGRLFKPREIATLAKAALAQEGPLDTRELAVRVIRAKGMDEGDRVLRASIAFRITQALNMQAKRGSVGTLPKRKGVRMWSTI
ncbi:MAG: hypothetical protein Q8M24_12020 [Pseudolabrys sp.]|nr:hypothetical protein [Pseudolabrys sp.]